MLNSDRGRNQSLIRERSKSSRKGSDVLGVVFDIVTFLYPLVSGTVVSHPRASLLD
jgi:hypothetical protein